jgi:hypothetical protein
MFGTHVSNHLSAYCSGELPQGEMRRVSEHLLKCVQCRREYDAVRFGVAVGRTLSPAKAPDDLWTTIEGALERGEGSRAPASSWDRLRGYVARPVAIRVGAVAAAVIAAFGLVWVLREPNAQRPTVPTVPSLRVESTAGTPLVDSSPLGAIGALPEGSWLITDDRSRATIQLADIGTVDVESNSRVRLVDTDVALQRLELVEGRVSAHVLAPPRLFVIDTPSATAVDLGCAYTLEVDDLGASILRVTSGWVALAIGGHEIEVPAGAVCRSVPGRGQGMPYFEDASPAFRSAVDYFDVTSDASALDVVLREARARDTLTLWNLLRRVDGSVRARVYARLAALSPPPEGVTRERALALDEAALDRWYDEIEYSWYR